MQKVRDQVDDKLGAALGSLQSRLAANREKRKQIHCAPPTDNSSLRNQALNSPQHMRTQPEFDRAADE